MIHNFCNFLCTHLTECSTKNCKIIGKKENLFSVYSSISCYYTIPKEFFILHIKFVIMVSRHGINFGKASFVKKQVNSLSSGKFTLFMLALNPFLSAALLCLTPFM